ncbi:MFS transporter [Paenibacillus rhizosphaerae]|uniref:MFS transporter n=1 Tax=Paenibacillus rhizosphaerae TaxID=297318 RepID=A0A1R1F1X1_9BACL|nr:MFS transporter [Paenibacillus rhizosphaerae]OMF57946.1 MFS transporter [Paenibacillus rhizosphaerae]
MQYIQIGTRAYFRVLVSMLLGSLVTFAILYSPQPLIGTFAKEFHVSPSSASFIISFSTITLAVTMLFVSLLSNAWGRRGVMSVSLFVTSVLAIASSFSTNFHLLLAARLLEGVSLAGFPAIAMTYLNEEIEPRSIGQVMGFYVAGTAVGGFAGRVIISLITDFFNWHIAMFVLGLVSLLCSVMFWLYLPKSNHFKPVSISLHHWADGFRNGFANTRLLCLYLIGFLLLGAYVTLFNYIDFPLSQPPYELSQTLIGCLFVFQLIGSWSSVWFGKLADRYSRAGLIASGLGMLLVGALLMLAGNVVFMIAGMILFACGFFAGHTVASGWVGKAAPMRYKAYASSLYLLFYYTGSSLVGWSGGFFLSSFGWNGVIWMIMALIVVTALLLLYVSRSSRQERHGSEAKPTAL